MLAFGAVLESCGGGGSPTAPSSVASLPTVNASIANGTEVLTVDSGSPLAPVGSAALVQTSSGSLQVAHTGQDAFSALSATCTHQVCTISGYQSQVFVCPCHGSQFNTSGGVVKGPATRPLSQHATQFANNVLTISL